MKISDIVYELGQFWVFKGKDAYYVMENGVTSSTSDSAYALDPDGLSIAIARVKYLERTRK